MNDDLATVFRREIGRCTATLIRVHAALERIDVERLVDYQPYHDERCRAKVPVEPAGCGARLTLLDYALACR